MPPEHPGSKWHRPCELLGSAPMSVRSRSFARVAALGLVAAAMLVSRPAVVLRSAADPPVIEQVDGRPAMAGEVLVKFNRQLGRLERAQFENGIDTDRSEAVGDGGIRRLHSRSLSAARLLALLRTHPDVTFVEPNYIIQADKTPNDPWFGQLWGLLNTGQTVGVAGTAGDDIKATLAWDVSTGSASTVVAVIDSGIDYTHSDLAPNAWSAPQAFSVVIGGRTIRCSAGTHGFNAIASTCDPYDDNGHGSHTSGTIGAAGNNGLGVTGVNWTTRLMGIKFLYSTGTGFVSNAINGIEFAIQAAAAAGANVRVLNNSWSTAGFSQALLDEINKANANGMLFVASAGNDATNSDLTPKYPASYTAPNVIAVAATTNTDALASFSNYGPASVHLAAPGVNILSTTPGEVYQYLSGTSMAAPHVSGAAALLLSRCALDTTALKATLLATVDPVPLLAGRLITGGRLNVNSAIRACVPDFSVAASPASQSAPPGSSSNYAIAVPASCGFGGTVTFSVSGLPDA